MRKQLTKFIMSRHSTQIVCLFGCLPSLILYLQGTINPFGLAMIGFNLGMATSTFFYNRAQARAEKWMRRAMRIQMEPVEIEKMIHVAEGMVAARMRSAHIDPDLN